MLQNDGVGQRSLGPGDGLDVAQRPGEVDDVDRSQVPKGGRCHVRSPTRRCRVRAASVTEPLNEG